jgi:uncharacterized FlaG/YvyC family protein
MDVQPAPPAAAVPAGAVQPQPQAQNQAVPAQPAPQSGRADEKATLSPIIAKLFHNAGALQPISVHVSYRSEQGTIVTIFSDPATGKEISQVPAEMLVQLAQFFDKHRGVTLDKSA